MWSIVTCSYVCGWLCHINTGFWWFFTSQQSCCFDQAFCHINVCNNDRDSAWLNETHCSNNKNHLSSARDNTLNHLLAQKINQKLFMACWDLMTKKNFIQLSDCAVLNLSALRIFCDSIKKNFVLKNQCVVSDFLPGVLCGVLVDTFRVELQVSQSAEPVSVDCLSVSYPICFPLCCIVFWVTWVRNCATNKWSGIKMTTLSSIKTLYMEGHSSMTWLTGTINILDVFGLVIYQVWRTFRLRHALKIQLVEVTTEYCGAVTGKITLTSLLW